MWQDQAACLGTDTEAFMEQRELNLLARTCGACPVKMQCRLAGLVEEHGVWGNTSAIHRRKLRIRLGVSKEGVFDTRNISPERRKVLDTVALAESIGVRAAMRRMGFTDDQIHALHEPTVLDNKYSSLSERMSA